MTPRCACGQPAPNATICQACENELLSALDAVIGLAPELDITLTRQAVIGDRSPARSHSSPLPYDERAAEAAAQLRAVLTGWVHVLTEAG